MFINVYKQGNTCKVAVMCIVGPEWWTTDWLIVMLQRKMAPRVDSIVCVITAIILLKLEYRFILPIIIVNLSNYH